MPISEIFLKTIELRIFIFFSCIIGRELPPLVSLFLASVTFRLIHAANFLKKYYIYNDRIHYHRPKFLVIPLGKPMEVLKWDQHVKNGRYQIAYEIDTESL